MEGGCDPLRSTLWAQDLGRGPHALLSPCAFDQSPILLVWLLPGLQMSNVSVFVQLLTLGPPVISEMAPLVALTWHAVPRSWQSPAPGPTEVLVSPPP